MIKVAFIGAGSVVFSKNLTGDILSYPEFKDATLRYMDIDRERLEVGANLCRKVAKALGANPVIEATQDRREALKGVDFVINMVQIGGFNSTLVDFEIPRKYGLNFTIADTTGPGGFFRALRTYPMLIGLCRDMAEVCPGAVLLNYANPMSMNMQTILRSGTGVRAVGLCHSVQGTFSQLMRDIGESGEDVAFTCAGINHMAFFLELRKGGEDLYPRIFKAAEDPRVFGSNRVRYELMKRLGYFVTESSEHNAEYCAHFIPHGKETLKEFDIPIDEYLRRCDGIVDEFERMKAFSGSDEPIVVRRSHEYGSTIIHSIATGTPSVVYGNMRNGGAIANLPADAIAEVPTLVDRSGLRFTTVGDLPPQLVGYMMPHVVQHELFIRAAMEGRRDHVYQAAMMDPLTAAMVRTDKIVEMCDEMIAAHGDLLPKLDAPVRVPSSGKSFSPPTPEELRASWDAQEKRKSEETLKTWNVLGPFEVPGEKAFGTATQTAFEQAFEGSGEVDLGAAWEGKVWEPLVAGDSGFVDLGAKFGPLPTAIAYAYTEVESIHAREAVLKCGSDDGIRVWLNGKLVHECDKKRGYLSAQDKFEAYLEEGKNTLLVKVTNFDGAWGFSLSVPLANF